MSQATKGAKAKGKAGAEESTPVFAVKGTPEYRAWFTQVQESTMLTASTLVRAALAEWATKRGYPAPPEAVRKRGRKG